VRLRRDLQGALIGNSESLMAAHFVVLFLVGSLVGGSLFVRVMLLVSLLLWSLTYYGGVWLDEAELRAGSRIHLFRIDRDKVRGARKGTAVHARGWMAPGIDLVIDRGKIAHLPMSALLGAQRRNEWIDAINEWAGAEESLRRGYRPADAWSLDKFIGGYRADYRDEE